MKFSKSIRRLKTSVIRVFQCGYPTRNWARFIHKSIPLVSPSLDFVAAPPFFGLKWRRYLDKSIFISPYPRSFLFFLPPFLSFFLFSFLSYFLTSYLVAIIPLFNRIISHLSIEIFKKTKKSSWKNLDNEYLEKSYQIA